MGRHVWQWGIVLVLAATCGAGARAGQGTIVFSKEPIDPANPQNLTRSFQAGDSIYGLMQPRQTWRELYGDKAKEQAMLLLMWTLDGQPKVGGYITVVKPAYIDSKTLVFDVAPALARMTAYRDPGVEYDQHRGIKKGACQFTLELSQLKPGKHTVEFCILDFGEKHVVGSFDIEGQDYSAYAKLHEQIKADVTGARTLPAAQKTDKAMEDEMRKLLLNAGWPNVLRLNIVDKDWWIDREAGGDSPVKSRHMDAAAACKDKDGKCYYRVCTFHQQRQVGGGFGALELTHQGIPVPIPEENIPK